MAPLLLGSELGGAARRSCFRFPPGARAASTADSCVQGAGESLSLPPSPLPPPSAQAPLPHSVHPTLSSAPGRISGHRTSLLSGDAHHLSRQTCELLKTGAGRAILRPRVSRHLTQVSPCPRLDPPSVTCRTYEAGKAGEMTSPMGVRGLFGGIPTRTYGLLFSQGDREQDV